ncbi:MULTISPECIES: type IV secretion system protein [unclassified Agrobacterium]|jgi:type IV secretion system protein VirB6|uniref:Type IV secretion system protein VirB6 n=2 Tax=Methylorubrum populi TaxID=223967 RepID=A0A161JLQ5_9HYPH|nr:MULTISPECIES: type IV secretion system protein [unclassified Agrobacterium]MDH0699718.1 type IV secretion system protein [Agrobacterium sp. GD03871]MDH1062571.1 type IV secretion system protein [Agrobacterium sp. GD03992]MDH2228062.1 type IV secretion system protein [Agrobacterium sp. GD03642]BAU94188.1 type IV secretion system protein VirB6 [Methylorubrum populi]
MNDIQWQVFAYIVSKVETPLMTAVASVMNAFLTFVAAPLKVALVLYIALTGILIIRGETNEAGAPLLGRILKMALVVWVITGAGIYQQYVYDFFFTTLPTGLANALTSGGRAQTITANSFDQVWIKAWRAGLEVWRTLSWKDIAEKAVIVLFWFVAIISTVFCFAIWMISRVLLALYIAIGPLLVGLVLFPATRAIFERWIGSLISCVILQITTIVLLYIVLQVEAEVVGQVAALGSVDSMAMIQVLLAGVIFFAVAAFVAFQLPGMASSLAGGLHFHVGAVARTMQNTIGSFGRNRPDGAGGTYREGRSGALGLGHYAGSLAGRGALAGGRAVYQRVRPTTGGSLSDRGPG